MTSNTEYDRLIADAETHAANARAAIGQASTRIEHIRSTALALEAENLVHVLRILRSWPEVDRTATTA